MASIKCTACGHRHFQPVPNCINCGAPLAAATFMARSQAEVTIVQSDTTNAIDATSAQSAPIRKHNSASAKNVSGEKPMRKTPNQATHALTSQETPSRQLITSDTGMQTTTENRRWQKQNQNQNQNQNMLQIYEPYETAVDIATQDPFTSAPFGTTTVKEEQTGTSAVDPEYWKTAKFPLFWIRTRPALTGTVLHMEAKEEIIDHPDLVAAIAILLVELVWTITDIRNERDSDRVVMTTLRIRTYANTLKDARIRGNMRGADLSLGDEISFWGVRRHGVLFVRRGFNHTTSGVVSTQSMGLLLPALLVLACFIAGIYFIPTWLPGAAHLIANNLGHFLSFLQQHPIKVPQQKK